MNKPLEKTTFGGFWHRLAARLTLAAVVALFAATLSFAAMAQDDDSDTSGDDNATSQKDDADDEKPQELEKVTVTAPHYVSTGSRSATKTNAPLIEIPQSVTVISRDQIDLLHWTDLEQTVRYTSGAIGNVFGPDPRYDWLYVRGFQPVQYIDGLRAPIGSVSNVGTDLYGYQAVDILKGPSSVMYGSAPPGGIVNMTSRRPEPVFSGEVGIQGGSFGRGQFNTDVTGPMGDNGSGRFTMLYRDVGTQLDFVDTKRFYVAPAYKYDFSPDTSITLLGYYQKDNIDNQSTGFLPAQGTLLPNPNGRIPIDRNIGEPGVNFYDREQYGVGYDFEHAFSDMFSIEQNLKYFNSDINSREIFGTGLLDADGDGVPDDFRTVTRSDFPFNENIDSFNVDTRGYLDLASGDVTHKVLIGIDYRDYDNTSEFGFAPAPPIDVYDPQYGAPIDDPQLFPFADQHQKQTGLYLQDQIHLGKAVFTLSGRQDWLDSTNSDVDTNRNEFTYRVGVNYLFDNGVAPYVSAASSFEPVAGADFDGNPFDPSTGKQYEVGIKYAGNDPTADVQFLGTVAAYHLVQEDVLTPDPDHVFFSVQTGEVTVDGFELEGVARFWQQLSINASYSYIDSEVTQSNGPDLGKQLPVVPKQKISLLGDYTIGTGPLAGLGFNLGVRHHGSTYGDPANQFKSPAVTLWDGTVRYDYGFWRFALNVSNITDKEYVARCDGFTNCFYGTRRVIIASITRRF